MRPCTQLACADRDPPVLGAPVCVAGVLAASAGVSRGDLVAVCVAVELPGQTRLVLCLPALLVRLFGAGTRISLYLELPGQARSVLKVRIFHSELSAGLLALQLISFLFGAVRTDKVSGVAMCVWQVCMCSEPCRHLGSAKAGQVRWFTCN